jgi:hypothetical protein
LYRNQQKNKNTPEKMYEAEGICVSTLKIEDNIKNQSPIAMGHPAMMNTYRSFDLFFAIAAPFLSNQPYSAANSGVLF